MNRQQPVKVLAIVRRMERGGMESRLMDILRAVDAHRVSIDIYACSPESGSYDPEVLGLGSRIFYNPPLTVANMFWYIRRFKRFLEGHPEYRIVHAHQNAWCSVFCKGAFMAGVPVRIAHARTALAEPGIKNAVKNVIKLPVRRYATHYFAVSEPAGRWLFGKRRLREGKVRVWKNAIDCKKYRFDPAVRRNVREELGFEGKKVIMHVGNFRRPKNQMFLLEIIRSLLPRQRDCRLVFVGGETGEGLEQKVKERAGQIGLKESVLFLGNRNDVAALLMAADVFCFPSIYEGLPGAVLEAQAAGLPCIVSDSVTEEVKILKSTRRLPLRAGADAWGREIEKALDVKRRDTYQEMRDAGFDIETLTQELTEFYEQAGR